MKIYRIAQSVRTKWIDVARNSVVIFPSFSPQNPTGYKKIDPKHALSLNPSFSNMELGIEFTNSTNVIVVNSN